MGSLVRIDAKVAQRSPASYALPGNGKFDAPEQDPRHVSFIRWTFGLVNRLVGCTDLALLLVAAVVASQVLPGAEPLQPLRRGLLWLTEAAVFLAMMAQFGAYRFERYTGGPLYVLHLAAAMVPAAAAGLVLLMAFEADGWSEVRHLVAWNLMALGLLLAGRQVQRLLLGTETLRRLLRRRVVIVGATEVTERLVREFSAAGQKDAYGVVAVFRATGDEPQRDFVGGVPVLGDLRALSTYARDNTIDVLVLALPWSKAREIFGLVETLSWIATDVVVPFDESAVGMDQLRMNIGRLSAIQVMSRPFKGSQGVLKVAEDYVVASLALLLVGPIMLVAALAIRLESPGPVLFRQLRPGFGTKPFTIYKFRTMYHDPNDDPRIGTTGPNDARVTRVGAVLRRLSFDELPQLFNVLRGEMSVVGPRPYVADMLVENERFSDLREYAARHRFKPGLTGYAQAHGMRSFALRSKENARRSVEMDLRYMRKWSLWLDFRIMVRTLAVGLAGRHVF